MAIAMANVKNEDIVLSFQNGFAQTQVMSDVYPQVKVFRCAVKAGTTIRSRAYSKAHQILALTGGNGYITTLQRVYNVDELSFFIANLDEEFTIHAVTDMVYTKFVVELTEHDMEVFNTFHIVLPYFLSIGNAQEYWQSCKAENTRSWTVLATKRLNRCLMGVVRSENGGGTFEKGHPAVAQWNIILDGADMRLYVESESEAAQHPGDISYVEAGKDHHLYAEPGKRVHYIWFEHYVQEKDYIVTNPHREYKPGND